VETPFNSTLGVAGRDIESTGFAKNQLACPRGYIRKTETKIAIGPENAIALYGLIPTNLAISNCLKQNPISPKAP